MLDIDAHLERGPMKFGLVHFEKEPWLTSSIDGFSIFQVDSRLKEALIETKTITSTGTKSMLQVNQKNRACSRATSLEIETSRMLLAASFIVHRCLITL